MASAAIGVMVSTRYHALSPRLQLATAGPAELVTCDQTIERTINRLKGWRRLATRYDKRDVNYLAMVTIAAIVLLWLD
jgi:transposase